MTIRSAAPGLVACILSLMTFSAHAAEVISAPRAVVELFTSQGCSSCPKADRLLNDVAERSDVVALAWHVDYWDYIGWADTFGSPDSTARQKGYARMLDNRVFTPQLVLNGQVDIVGSDHKGLMDGIADGGLAVPVSLAVTDKMLKVSIPARPEETGEAVVWLVTFIEKADVAIERGENAGKTVTYSHIAIARQALGMWNSAEPMTLKLPLGEVLTGEADGAAILLQRETGGLPGPILGAAAFTD